MTALEEAVDDMVRRFGGGAPARARRNANEASTSDHRVWWRLVANECERVLREERE